MITFRKNNSIHYYNHSYMPSHSFQNDYPFSSFATRFKNCKDHLKRVLYDKYNCETQQYNLIIINNLLESKNCHLVVIFKEYLISDYIDEFLKREYNLNEIKERIPRLARFYKNYLLFFCLPTMRNMELNSIIKQLGEDKAENFYKLNYPDESNDDSPSSENNDNTSQDQLDKNKLENIFTNKVKENIDNVSIITNKEKNEETISLRTGENEVVKLQGDFKYSNENTLLGIMNNFNANNKRYHLIKGKGKVKNNINKEDGNKKMKLSMITRDIINNIIKKGILTNYNIKNALLNKKEVRRNNKLISYKHTLPIKKQSPPKSKNKNKTIPKSNMNSINNNFVANTKITNAFPSNHSKSRNLNKYKNFGILFKTTDLCLINSIQSKMLTKTQNMENYISSCSLSKKKFQIPKPNPINIKHSRNIQQNSKSKKKIISDIKPNIIIHNHNFLRNSTNHIKPLIKIKKSSSNIKILTSSCSGFNHIRPTYNQNISSSKNDLMKIAFLFQMENNNSKIKANHHHSNTNINININNQININTNNSVNGRGISMNSLNEKLNKKISRNDEISYNIKSNLNHLTRNLSSNNQNLICTNYNNRLITSYHNKSMAGTNAIVARKIKGSLRKSQSKNKKKKF